ncbi:MBL fold metallo-hydrolase [Mucilaginibacter sp. CSA2-8R]|uniref:MBL fold metallo-hydrolase n=1 Tax=Mucilaginibacter sp. CSA2-8R TaxID=3141542 RepID=UPI00315CFF92
MKISKYLHSCLTFEKDDFKLLVDPGMFSFAEGLVKPEIFSDVSAIIITHNHPDHLDVENLKKILAAGNAEVYANAQVKQEMEKAGINAVLLHEGTVNIGPFKIEAISVKHEPLLDAPAPEMTALVIDDCILHPVDSFEEKLLTYKNIELLLLPIMAPFTNEIKVADFADRLQPKQILPVHDGFAKPFFVQSRQANYAAHFEKQCIKFHRLTEPGSFIEI